MKRFVQGSLEIHAGVHEISLQWLLSSIVLDNGMGDFEFDARCLRYALKAHGDKDLTSMCQRNTFLKSHVLVLLFIYTYIYVCVAAKHVVCGFKALKRRKRSLYFQNSLAQEQSMIYGLSKTSMMFWGSRDARMGGASAHSLCLSTIYLHP